MTNLEQRAEETAEWIATCNLQNGPIIVPFMKEKILLALRQTREEALADIKNNEKWHKAGYLDGLGKATKIADNYESQINGAQDFRDGWKQAAKAIEEAIRTVASGSEE